MRSKPNMPTLKRIINIIGGTGVGKSTLGAALAGTDGVNMLTEAQVDGNKVQVQYAYFPTSKTLMLGNSTSGTDACKSMLGGAALLPLWLGRKDVQQVILNPLRCSRSWSVDMLHRFEVPIIYCCFEVTFKENILRICRRRANAGKGVLSPAELENVENFYKRAAGVMAYVRNRLRPQDTYIGLLDKCNAAQALKRVQEALR